MKCTAPLIFAGGGNRPRFCGKPATVVLSDGKGRCSKHARGRGTPIAQWERIPAGDHMLNEPKAATLDRVKPVPPSPPPRRRK